MTSKDWFQRVQSN